MSISPVIDRRIVISSGQVARLSGLAEAANTLFKPRQEISVIELIYAALWRCAGKGGLCSTLTIVECSSNILETGNAGAEAGATMPPVRHTLTSTLDYLESQPLVSIAHVIRGCVCDNQSDTRYEGWLVDSLGSGAVHGDLPGSADLTLSILPLPYLQEILLDELQGRSQRMARTCSEVLTAALPQRICCINVEDAGCFVRDHVSADSGYASPRRKLQKYGSISIDMRLPLSEFDSFKSQYADHWCTGYGPFGHGSLKDEFFQN